MLIVNSSKEARIARGVWEIINHPYYYGSCLGTDGFFKDALRYLGPLRKSKEVDTEGYPCGHVCRYCDREIKVKATANWRVGNVEKLNSREGELSR